MDTAKKEKDHALIAAIFFTVYTVLTLCEDVYYRIEDLRAFPENGIDAASLILDALFYVTLIIIAVALFCKSKTALTVGAAATVLFSSIPYAMNLISRNYDAVGETYSAIAKIYVLSIAAYAVLLLMLVLSLKKYDSIIKSIWLLPSALILIYYIFTYIIATRSLINFDRNIISVIIDIVDIFVIICEVSALFFAGMWIKASAPSVAAPAPAPAVEPAPVPAPAKEVAQPVISGARELREYKELLDIGAITEDEYEQKKKQILNL